MFVSLCLLSPVSCLCLCACLSASFSISNPSFLLFLFASFFLLKWGCCQLPQTEVLLYGFLVTTATLSVAKQGVWNALLLDNQFYMNSWNTGFHSVQCVCILCTDVMILFYSGREEGGAGVLLCMFRVSNYTLSFLTLLFVFSPQTGWWQRCVQMTALLFFTLFFVFFPLRQVGDWVVYRWLFCIFSRCLWFFPSDKSVTELCTDDLFVFFFTLLCIFSVRQVGDRDVYMWPLCFFHIIVYFSFRQVGDRDVYRWPLCVFFTLLCLFPSDKSVTEVCTDDHFVCWDKNGCIPFNKTCDGRSDCMDASDEGIVYCSKSCLELVGEGEAWFVWMWILGQTVVLCPRPNEVGLCIVWEPIWGKSSHTTPWGMLLL